MMEKSKKSSDRIAWRAITVSHGAAVVKKNSSLTQSPPHSLRRRTAVLLSPDPGCEEFKKGIWVWGVAGVGV